MSHLKTISVYLFGRITSSLLRNTKRNGVTKKEEMNIVLYITIKLHKYMGIIFHFLKVCHGNVRGLSGQ